MGSGDLTRYRIAELVARYAELWRQTPGHEPDLGPPVSRRRQRRSARECERLIPRLARRCEAYPEDPAQRQGWRDELERELLLFGEEHFGWPPGYRRLLVSEGYYRSSVAFARAARRFDPMISADDVGQALRNVWIVGSLQMLLDVDVRLSPSVFAYSMLYPYTDNLLDDPELSRGRKREFSARLGRRLAGLEAEPQGGHEAAVFRLVAMIEGEYPRRRFPDVFLGLQAIHRAQGRSLDQQRGDVEGVDVLGISIEKGGTSVLPDGLLIGGSLTPEEIDFCFGYGVFLQLLDDLQDVGSDLAAGHWTLFSQAARGRPLDRLASRLHRFVSRVLDRSSRFAGRRYGARKDLIRRNCTALLVGAVAENERLFSRRFRRQVEARWPISLRAMRRLRRLAERQYRRTGERLRRHRRVASLVELLAAESDPAADPICPAPRL